MFKSLGFRVKVLGFRFYLEDNGGLSSRLAINAVPSMTRLLQVTPPTVTARTAQYWEVVFAVGLSHVPSMSYTGLHKGGFRT